MSTVQDFNERPSNSPPGQPQIVIQNIPPKQPWLSSTLLKIALGISILANFALFGAVQAYFPRLGANEKFVSGKPSARDKIVLIKVSGMITSESIQRPKQELESLADDKHVKAVVLAVESPGGTIGGSDELYHAIERFKEKTSVPVIVSMQGLATSGAYYISAPADKIFADVTCITGSIGVVANFFNVEKLFNEWGVAASVIKSGDMKDSGSPFRPMTEAEQEEWKGLIMSMYDRFLAIILEHRSEQIGGEEKLRQLADGRVYLAEQAKELGLIDEIGYQNDAIEAAKEMAGTGDDVRVITFRRPTGILALLEEASAEGPNVPTGRVAEMLGPRPLLLPSGFLPAALNPAP